MGTGLYKRLSNEELVELYKAGESDVLVGKNVSKKYAVSSLYSTLKAMAL